MFMVLMLLDNLARRIHEWSIPVLGSLRSLSLKVCSVRRRCYKAEALFTMLMSKGLVLSLGWLLMGRRAWLTGGLYETLCTLLYSSWITVNKPGIVVTNSQLKKLTRFTIDVREGVHAVSCLMPSSTVYMAGLFTIDGLYVLFLLDSLG